MTGGKIGFGSQLHQVFKNKLCDLDAIKTVCKYCKIEHRYQEKRNDAKLTLLENKCLNRAKRRNNSV